MATPVRCCSRPGAPALARRVQVNSWLLPEVFKTGDGRMVDRAVFGEATDTFTLLDLTDDTQLQAQFPAQIRKPPGVRGRQREQQFVIVTTR